MATRAGIEAAIDALDEAAYACGEDVSTGFPYPRQSFVDRRRDARARLLALLAPEPEPSDAEIEAGAMVIPGKWEAALELSRDVLAAAGQEASNG